MITVVNAFAPVAAISGTTQSTSSFQQVSSSSAISVFSLVSYLEAVAGSAGVVTLTAAPLVFDIAVGSDEGLYGLMLQWQKWNGSTWGNLGTATAETSQAYYATLFQFGGVISCSHSDTGLSPGVSYRYRLMGWVVDRVGRSRIISGTASAAGT